METIYYWIWLLLVFGAGNRKIWKILEHYETPQTAYTALQTEKLPFLKERDVRSIKTVTMEQVEKIIQNCKEKQIAMVCFDDENYPEQLRQIYNPPIVLFYQGQLSLLTDYPCLTVVGTRNPSDYSIQTADLLCRCLAKSGMLLVSGFAVGLDSVAHRAALLSGGKTVAVMGCGLDVPYPKVNASAKKYIIRNGLMLSEFLPGTEPARQNFPMRNRILAGVSSGTLVIQAPVGSGALITAEQAMEQGKPVFCLPPADIFDNQYAGVVKYLREGAIPVFAPEDILREYHDSCEQRLQEISLDMILKQQSAEKPAQSAHAAAASSRNTTDAVGENAASRKSSVKEVAVEPVKPAADVAVLETLEGLTKQIMALLLEQSPLQIDQIVQTVQADAEEVAACLTELAIAQLVQRMPGQYYSVL
ncbi:MAG: DNA-processing protein DprA [Oscillospiraceae bacterium]|nr:DNA-processing protein DprA [Oscillospiraceae bacterium]